MKGRVVVIGAGPVGSLLALFLARRGLEVDVYERRPDMRREGSGEGRSINLAVSTRGLYALSQMGLDREVLEETIPMPGRMIHAADGSLAFQPYGRDPSECIRSMSRAGLNRLLIARAEGTGRVQFHFRMRAVDADPGEGRARFVDETAGKECLIQGDALFGADGSASVVRQAIAARGRFSLREDRLDYGYKELTLPAGPAAAFLLQKNALHIWPRGTFMLIALPNLDGTFTCTLFLPFDGAGEENFRELDSAVRVEAFFARHFPDALRLMPSVAEQFLAHPTGSMVTVRTDGWTDGKRTLLVGDAAHAIVPFFGQGMNCGFEDCTELDGILAEGAPWDEALPRFVAGRRADADAIADLALENFVEMRDRVGDPKFLFEKKVEKILEKELPDAYLSRYALVTFTRTPYRVALEVGRICDGILAELCWGLSEPEALDRARARVLVESRLAPFLREKGVLHGSGASR